MSSTTRADRRIRATTWRIWRVIRSQLSPSAPPPGPARVLAPDRVGHDARRESRRDTVITKSAYDHHMSEPIEIPDDLIALQRTQNEALAALGGPDVGPPSSW